MSLRLAAAIAVALALATPARASEPGRRSRWLIAAGVCIGVLAALVTVRLTTPQVFLARAAVAVDLDELPRELVFRTVQGESEIDLRRVRVALLSDAALHEVIVRTFPIPSSPEVERHLADVIRSRLALTYRRMTSAIEFRYHDSDPVRAAEVVNLFARFFGEEDIVSAAALPVVQVAPNRTDYLALGVVGGVLGGLLVLLGRLLGLVAVERFGMNTDVPR